MNSNSDGDKTHFFPTKDAPKDWPFVVPMNHGFSALVDEQDYDSVRGHSWSVSTSGKNHYAIRRLKIHELEGIEPVRYKSGKKKAYRILMHRFLIGDTGGLSIDHINGNGLDNRRCNLRLATIAQNSRNRHSTHGSSRFKGVSWFKRHSVWMATITCKSEATGKSELHGIGYYRSEEDAALAYDRKAVELFGDFASLNLPGQDDGRILCKSANQTKGEECHASKLNRLQVIEIRRRASEGEMQKHIADDFGVSRESVSCIVNRKSWKWLGDDTNKEEK